MLKTYIQGTNWLAQYARFSLLAFFVLVGMSNSALATCTINGGAIGNAQTGCSPFDPSAITNVTSVSSPYGGPFEYLWLKTTDANAVAGNNTNWTAISNSNSATYDPGPLTVTTWFRRCSRRAVSYCPNFDGESNWIKITVNAAPAAPAVTVTQPTCSSATGSLMITNLPSGASSSINGGTATVGKTSYTNLAPGTYTVTVSSNGCSSSSNVTINAAPATTINFNNCPANINLSTTANCATATWAAPTASSSCGTPSVTSNYNSGFCFPIGTTAVTYTATLNGVVKTCTFNVVVTQTNPCATDTQAPTIAGCPASQTVTAASGQTCATVSWTMPTATDNCTLVSFTSNFQSGNCFPVGTTNVVYTATDAAGNTKTCGFTVVVNPPAPPAADCNNIGITVGNGTITVTGVNTAPVVSIQVFNASWNQVFNQYYTNAPGSVTIPSLTTGQYFVKVQYLTSSWSEICKKEVFVNVTGTPQIPTVSINDVTVNENAGTATLTLTLSAPSATPITVQYSSSNGTAMNPGDYTPVTGTVTFPAGSTTATITIPITDDTTNEPTEVFNINLSNPSGVTIADNLGTVTILDNDNAPSVNCSNITFTAANGNITVGNLSNPGGVTIIQAYDANWNQVFNQYYTTTPASVTIPNLTGGNYWVKAQYLTTSWSEICKKEESVTVGGGGTPCSISGVVGNKVCNNNGTPSNPADDTFTFELTVNATGGCSNTWTGSFAGVNISGTYGTVKVLGPFAIGAGTPSDVWVHDSNNTNAMFDITITPPATCSGTAPGPDCNAISVTGGNGSIALSGLTAPIVMVQAFNSAWNTVFNQYYTNGPGTLSIPSLPAGSYFVKVTFLTSAWGTICAKEIYVTVGGGAPVPSLTINDVTVNENAGTATLQICASQAATSAITVSYSTVAGTALAGGDYTAATATATIPAGQTCTTVTIAITDDNVSESTEVFHVYLSNPTGATIGDLEGLVTILDNDPVTPPPGGNCDNVTATAGNGTITVGGVTAPVTSVQVFNAAWNTVFNQYYTNQPGTVTVPSLTAGTYYVKVDYYTAGWSPICTKNFTVTVTGGTPTGVLTFPQPGNITVTAPAGQNSMMVTYPTPTASSTCTVGTVNVTYLSGLTSGSSFPVGNTQVCYRATDGCGNQIDRCFTVTVNAGTPTGVLTFPQPGNITVTAPSGQSSMVVTYPTPTASSTCTVGTVNVTYLSGLTSGSSFPVGNTQVCYRATDGCGNQIDRCFTVTVNAPAGPVCNVTRTVTNSSLRNQDCSVNGEGYGMWFNINYPGTTSPRYTMSNATFTENADGTASLTAVATNNQNSNIKFNVNVSFCGRTYVAPAGSPKAPCYAYNSNGWYYYTTTCGTLTGTNGAAGTVISITRMGEAFQVGTGANLNQNVFGASGWFNTYVTSGSVSGLTSGDFNFNLSGTPTAPACGTGTANCSSVACYSAPTFPNPNVCYRIVNKASGQAMDTDNHPWLTQRPVDGTSSQAWRLVSAGGDYYYITSNSTNYNGQVVDIQNGSTADNALADIVNKTNADCQKFKLQDAGNGYFYLVAKHSGKALKLVNTPGTDGTQIKQLGINSSFEHQKWKFETVTCTYASVAQTAAVSLSASRKANSVDLRWMSNTGTQNTSYAVERSVDGTNFEVIATGNAVSQSDIVYYNATDNTPAKADNIYRVRMFLNDGTERVSNEQKVFMPEVGSFGVYPNPASERTFVDVSDFAGQNVTIQLFNQLGKLVKTVEVSATNGTVEIELNDLNSGFYGINIQSNGVNRSSKLVITKK